MNWVDHPDGGDQSGILTLMDEDDIAFSPMETGMHAVAFDNDEFMTMSMQMGKVRY